MQVIVNILNAPNPATALVRPARKRPARMCAPIQIRKMQLHAIKMAKMEFVTKGFAFQIVLKMDVKTVMYVTRQAGYALNALSQKTANPLPAKVQSVCRTAAVMTILIMVQIVMTAFAFREAAFHPVRMTANVEGTRLIARRTLELVLNAQPKVIVIFMIVKI